MIISSDDQWLIYTFPAVLFNTIKDKHQIGSCWMLMLAVPFCVSLPVWPIRRNLEPPDSRRQTCSDSVFCVCLVTTRVHRLFCFRDRIHSVRVRPTSRFGLKFVFCSTTETVRDVLHWPELPAPVWQLCGFSSVFPICGCCVCRQCCQSSVSARSGGHVAVFLSLWGRHAALAAVGAVEESQQRAAVSLHQTQILPELQRRLQHHLQARQHHTHHPTGPERGLRNSHLLCEQTTRVLWLQRGAGQDARWVGQVRGRGFNERESCEVTGCVCFYRFCHLSSKQWMDPVRYVHMRFNSPHAVNVTVLKEYSTTK